MAIDKQRKKAVSDMERRKKEEQEQVIVSPGLSPTGQQATISRAQFNQQLRTKQEQQIQTKTEQQALKKEPKIAGLSAEQMPEQQGIMQPQPSNSLIQPQKKGTIQNIAQTREFPAVGITGINTAARLLTQPGQELKRAGTETAIGAGLGLGFAGQLAAATARIRAMSTITKTFLGLSFSSLVGKYGIASRQGVSNATNDFQNAKTNINDIIKDVNNGFYPNPIDAIDAYELEVRAIRKQQQALKKATDTWLKRLIGGGVNDLADVNNFLDNERRYRLLLQQAILTPNPQMIMNEEQPIQND